MPTYSKQKGPEYRRNEEIRSPKLLVIDDEGEQLGVLNTSEALALARERELDLVEVAPNANPPVAKILSWSKFKYQQEKKRKESKTRRIEQKEMWFKAFIDKGDLQHKVKRIKEFLAKRHTVKLTVKARGRVSSEQMRGVLTNVLTELEGFAEPEETPKLMNRTLSVIVKPLKQIKSTDNEKQN